MGRGLAEEELQPPIDLRLVPVAIAVWAGRVVGLSAAPWLWTAAFCCTALLLTTAVVPGVRRQLWWAGALTALAGGVAALFISLLYWHSAQHNPLTLAAVKGSFATVAMTVTAAPRELPSPF